MNVLEKICKYFLENDYNDLPSEILETAKKNIIDIFGTVIAGSRNKDVLNLIKLLKRYDHTEESSVFVYGEKMSSMSAAMINATMGRICDFDDVQEKGVSHIGVGIIPVAASVGETKSINGKTLLTAVALGYDFASRICLTSKLPRDVSGMALGCHTAVLSGAAMAGKIKRFNLKTLKNALGIAYSFVSGTDQCLIEGSIMFSLQKGISSSAAIFATLLAESGIEGPENIFEGKFGYYNSYQRGKYDINILTNELGHIFEGPNISIKLYPCCLWTRSAIEGLISLLDNKKICNEDVKRVNVFVNRQAFTYTCHPLNEKYTPKNEVEAKFSLPYILGCVLVNKKLTIKDFYSESINNPEYLKEAKKIIPIIDEEMDKVANHTIGPSRVEIILNNGMSYETCIRFSKGSPENPLSIEECLEKFMLCLDVAPKNYDSNVKKEICDLLRNLEHVENINEIINLINLKGNFKKNR